MNELLDYEIVYAADDKPDDRWQIWTPDKNGGIIGLGNTRNEAIQNAIAGMCSIVPKLVEEIDT